MANEEQDYLLRMLQELRQFIAQVVKTGDTSGANEALLAVVHAREKLFGKPTSEFGRLAVAEQLAWLAAGESPEKAREKCLTYAAILKSAALIYQVQNDDRMATSAYQLSLYIVLILAVQTQQSYAELRDEINDLKSKIPEEALNPPVRELLLQGQAEFETGPA
jgi:hypothetical protein